MGASRQLVPRGMFQAHSLIHGQHHCVVWLAVRSQWTVSMPMTGNIIDRWQLLFVLQQRQEGCSNPSLVTSVVPSTIANWEVSEI